MKIRRGIGLVVAIVVIGFTIAAYIQSELNKQADVTWVVVATQTIESDTVIPATSLTKELRPRAFLPANVITEVADAAGQYAATTILPGQPVQGDAVSAATTIRELIREKYGLDYVGQTIALDTTDVPAKLIRPGDNINIQGTFNEVANGQSVIYTEYIAENIPVLEVLADENKLFVAVPKEDSLRVAESMAVGKMRVVLDPNRYTGVRVTR